MSAGADVHCDAYELRGVLHNCRKPANHRSGHRCRCGFAWPKVAIVTNANDTPEEIRAQGWERQT